MTKVVPTQFELDMSRMGKKIGDPIPASVKSRPDPGEYGGIYDTKIEGQFVSTATPVSPVAEPLEHKTSEPKASGDQAGYRTRTSRPEVKKDDKTETAPKHA